MATHSYNTNITNYGLKQPEIYPIICPFVALTWWNLLIEKSH